MPWFLWFLGLFFGSCFGLESHCQSRGCPAWCFLIPDNAALRQWMSKTAKVAWIISIVAFSNASFSSHKCSEQLLHSALSNRSPFEMSRSTNSKAFLCFHFSCFHWFIDLFQIFSRQNSYNKSWNNFCTNFWRQKGDNFAFGRDQSSAWLGN